jgi:putative FmdB family regulatory protein
LVDFSMPIYEYQCQDCGKALEALQKISDEPLRDCPACGKAALKKKVSAAAFRLKGGGWYETDFKTGDKKNLAGGSDSSGDSGAGGKAGEQKSGESKAGESKASESKAGKSSESKKSA